jgi:hypothetical protein
MSTKVNIVLVIYIFAFIFSALLFALKRVAVIRYFNGEITVDLIDIFILSLRLVCISSLPFVNILYILIHTFGWSECMSELKIDIRANGYRLC